MHIPKIIHQTWKNKELPPRFTAMSRTWRTKHPDWEYRLWTDEMNRDFIIEHFPFFLNKYDGYENPIQRVDAVRYFALYRYGGIYVDMDFECLSDITPIISDAQCVFGMEPREHCMIHEKELIISNAFMAAVPAHDFIASLCRELQHTGEVTSHPNNNILETTGPFMLSRVYNSYPHKHLIKLLEPASIYPLTKEELLLLENGPVTRPLQEKLDNAYAVHHYAGTWWKHKVT